MKAFEESKALKASKASKTGKADKEPEASMFPPAPTLEDNSDLHISVAKHYIPTKEGNTSHTVFTAGALLQEDSKARKVMEDGHESPLQALQALLYDIQLKIGILRHYRGHEITQAFCFLETSLRRTVATNLTLLNPLALPFYIDSRINADHDPELLCRHWNQGIANQQQIDIDALRKRSGLDSTPDQTAHSQFPAMCLEQVPRGLGVESPVSTDSRSGQLLGHNMRYPATGHPNLDEINLAAARGITDVSPFRNDNVHPNDGLPSQLLTMSKYNLAGQNWCPSDGRPYCQVPGAWPGTCGHLDHANDGRLDAMTLVPTQYAGQQAQSPPATEVYMDTRAKSFGSPTSQHWPVSLQAGFSFNPVEPSQITSMTNSQIFDGRVDSPMASQWAMYQASPGIMSGGEQPTEDTIERGAESSYLMSVADTNAVDSMKDPPAPKRRGRPPKNRSEGAGNNTIIDIRKAKAVPANRRARKQTARKQTSSTTHTHSSMEASKEPIENQIEASLGCGKAKRNANTATKRRSPQSYLPTPPSEPPLEYQPKAVMSGDKAKGCTNTAERPGGTALRTECFLQEQRSRGVRQEPTPLREAHI